MIIVTIAIVDDFEIDKLCHNFLENQTRMKGRGLALLCESCEMTWTMVNWNQSVTFVWILIRTNIRIYSCQENDTNEYPNIFV